MMNKLNPFAKKQRELISKREADRHAKRAKMIKEKRSKSGKQTKAKRTALYWSLQKGLKDSFKAAEDLIAEEER